MNPRNPLWILMDREIRTRLTKKSYWVFTIVGLVILVALTFLPSLIHWVNGVSTTRVVMDDPAGIVAPTVEQVVGSNKQAYNFQVSVDDTKGVASMPSGQMQSYMKAHHTSLVVVVGGQSAANASFALEKRGTISATTLQQVTSLLKQTTMQERIATLPAQSQSALGAPVPIASHQWKAGVKSTQQMIQSTILVYFMLILLFATIVTYGTWVAQGVAEEKSNRIVEMMLVTCKPWQILFGKILGIGVVGLLQYVIWLGVMAISLEARQQLSSLPLGHIPASAFVLLPVFFILGYFLYATVYAIAGALVTRAEEQQMALTPVILIMVVFFYITLIGVLPQPDSAFSVVVSFIPVLTPMTMFTRAVMTDVPVWQILIGVVLTILVNAWMIRWGATVYRRFALRNSGKASWKLVWRKDATASGGRR